MNRSARRAGRRRERSAPRHPGTARRDVRCSSPRRATMLATHGLSRLVEWPDDADGSVVEHIVSDIPKTHYAEAPDGAYLAYQVLGGGPTDLLYVPGWRSHLEVYWEQPLYAGFMRRLAKSFRVITFDKRGTGLSERGVGAPDFETMMDDVRAVLDAAACRRPVLWGDGPDGGGSCAVFAASFPSERSPSSGGKPARERSRRPTTRGGRAGRNTPQTTPSSNRPGVTNSTVPSCSNSWDAPGILDSAREEELDRRLATVLFTDIVGSTDKACGSATHLEGAARAPPRAVRAMLARYRGAEVNTTGDGFLATFDGPARAVKCAQAICEAVKPLGPRGARRLPHRRDRAAGRRRRRHRRPHRRPRRALADPPRSSSARPSRTSSPARASSSRTAASTS